MGNRIYVGNLSFQATADTVRDAFAALGEVTDVHLVTDRDTGRSRGFAFVTMATDSLAQNAITAMNNTVLDGRPLRVNEAEARQQRSGGGGGGSDSNGARRGDRERRSRF
jgi:RNA recognition motif-containing protein